MKSTINYYYNLNPDNIYKMFDYYYFYVDNELYYFKLYNRKYEDRFAIMELNKNMINNNILVNEIINNRNNNVVTIVNKLPYILIKVVININKRITLSEINYLSSYRCNYDDKLMRGNWAYLWSSKIDYLEYFMEQNYKKYQLIVDSFNYFVGMAENAISYLNISIKNNRMSDNDIGVISHDIINSNYSIYELYDPLNIIIDHKARDISEYIKVSFWNDNFNIFEELDEYFKYNYFSYYGVCLIISRVIYPSFYFDIIDDIINGKRDESYILKITSRCVEYEKYLNDVFLYFKKFYDINTNLWFCNKKNEVLPH